MSVRVCVCVSRNLTQNLVNVRSCFLSYRFCGNPTSVVHFRLQQISQCFLQNKQNANGFNESGFLFYDNSPHLQLCIWLMGGGGYGDGTLVPAVVMVAIKTILYGLLAVVWTFGILNMNTTGRNKTISIRSFLGDFIGRQQQ